MLKAERLSTHGELPFYLGRQNIREKYSERERRKEGREEDGRSKGGK